MPEHLSVIMPVYNERYLVAESIARVLAVESPLISRLDLIVVDDGSTDGTRDILAEIAARHPDRMTYLPQAVNGGKGAAVRAGIAQARGSVTVIQDADLEYNPKDLAKLMLPFVHERADAVFGSRFLSAEYRRVLYYRHSLGNRVLTGLCNIITDLNLTDMETCYKAVRTRLLQSIPLRSPDFRMEPELTIKLAKRGARIFEVPVSYAGRTYEEGKKIGLRDAFLALGAMLRWWLIDDIFQPDEYGSNILVSMSGVPRFNRWMGDVLRPHVGARVLEVGAGIGNLSALLMPRDRYTVSDVNPHYIDYLHNFAEGKPYMDVRKVDITRADDVAPIAGRYDTVICLNVLEHLEDDHAALRNIRTALDASGAAIHGTLDDVLGHKRRYTRETLRALVESEGMVLEELFDFNRVTTPAWWFNGRVLKREHFSKVQLKGMNVMTSLMRVLENIVPWHGTSLIAVARKPAQP